MTSIEQSIVHPEVYFVKVGDATIKTDEENIKELIRSAMSTTTGKAMLKEYVNRIIKK